MRAWRIHGNNFDLSITHSIAAPREIVYEVLADMESYPEFINDLVSVKRDGNLYRFVARAAILTIPATVAVTMTPGQSVAFEMVEGPVDGLTGAWLIEAGDTPEESRVTLTIHAKTDQRSEWLLRMTGQYVENKTGKLIHAFSDRVSELRHPGFVPLSTPRTAAESAMIGWFKGLWARLFGKRTAPAPRTKPVLTLFEDEHHIQTLEALASTMIPPDEYDAGVQGLGFVSLAEIRARYEEGREEHYTTALNAIDKMAQIIFEKPHFLALSPAERTQLLDVVRQGQVKDAWGQIEPSAFFGALWEDVVFLYCTHPDTWQRIGFPGPSFDTGGHPDFAQAQNLMGGKRGE